MPGVTCCKGAADAIESECQKTKDDCTCTSKDTVSDAAVISGPDVHQLVRAKMFVKVLIVHRGCIQSVQLFIEK